MFQGFDREMIPFFLDLRFHNSKAFMDENRQRYYTHVRDPFYAFITALGERLLPLIPDLEIRPNKCLSRINRDTRFSRDKSPYRDHLWCAFRQSGVQKEGAPFYWFEIGPEHLSYGLGLWGENREAMDVLRRRIAAFPDEILRILPRIGEAGCLMAGREWKKLPVPETVPPQARDLYLKKDIYFEKIGTSLSWIYSPKIVDRVYETFALLLPFYKLFRGLAPDGLIQTEKE